MAHGKAVVGWDMVSSIIRAVSLSMCGQEPPLAAFIPNEFLPADLKRTPMTEAEEAEREEIIRKRDELDKQILAKAMADGKFKGRLNGTRK